MKRHRTLTYLFILCFTLVSFSYADELGYKYFFTPTSSILVEISNSIDNSRKQIRVAASKLSNKDLIRQLNLALSRGIPVQIIVDDDSTKDTKTQLALLAKQGACIYQDGSHKTFHNKYIIIDDSLVITGSYNYTRDSEENNAENVVFMYSTQAVKAYLTDWISHLKHSVHLKQSLTFSECRYNH